MVDDQTYEFWGENYLYMTIVFIRSLREIGYKEDIVVITNIKDYDGELIQEGVFVEHREFFDYPALYDYACGARHLSRYDILKVHYWSLPQYNKLLCLDSDILAGGWKEKDRTRKFEDWHLPEVQIPSGGVNSPTNSGLMLIQPSAKTHSEMRQILETATFSPETGWNECGPLWTITDWGFQAANAVQGFIPYYFNGVHLHNFRPYFRHYAGRMKYTEEAYTRELKRHGFELKIPHWVDHMKQC
jgi:hypothetical protein